MFLLLHVPHVVNCKILAIYQRLTVRQVVARWPSETSRKCVGRSFGRLINQYVEWLKENRHVFRSTHGSVSTTRRL
jgi:hypothetical protein